MSKSKSDESLLVTSQEVDEAITGPFPIEFLKQDIIAHVGEEIIRNLSLKQLENYCLRTIVRDEPTGNLLLVLMQNFITAYGQEATSEEAMKAFDYLTYLASAEEPPIDKAH